MAEHIFTGFGFGPIQGGLFVKEAFQSGNFMRMVVAEIDETIIDAVRANKGSYYVNVAKANGIEVLKIDKIELLNPNVARDRQILLQVLAESTEITTCLPSVDFYNLGAATSAASLIAEGLKNSSAKATVIYTAENNNRAAEILEKAVAEKIGPLPSKRVQFLNTVIGKMSRVVTDSAEITKLKLIPVAPGIGRAPPLRGAGRAFLVEEFNRILAGRIMISDFKPGIEVFIEKDDLLPFEEAKLYGHNAIHALLAYLGAVKGYTKMTELKEDSVIMRISRKAFLGECGAALIKKYCRLRDELFTEAGFRNYAEDLLERMTNPFLADAVERAGRNPLRKLGYSDRVFGAMSLALEYGIEPNNMALGALAGIATLLQEAEENNLPGNLRFGHWSKLDDLKIEKIINWIWDEQKGRYAQQLIKCVQNAQEHLATFMAE